MAGYRQNINLKFNRMSPRAVLRILFVIFGGGRKFTAFATLNLRSAERLRLRFGRFAQIYLILLCSNSAICVKFERANQTCFLKKLYGLGFCPKFTSENGSKFKFLRANFVKFDAQSLNLVAPLYSKFTELLKFCKR